VARAGGQRDFAENYAQELRDKRQRWPRPGALALHRPLQNNKSSTWRQCAGALARQLELAAEWIAAAPHQDILIQVNVAGERRSGSARGAALLDGCGAARCAAGLMVIRVAASRPHFAPCERCRREAPRAPHVDLRELRWE